MDRPLNDKVAIVTGASSGIGAAIATHLARAGAKVAIAARRIEKLQDLKASIEREGGVAIAVKTDVTNRDDVSQLETKWLESIAHLSFEVIIPIL